MAAGVRRIEALTSEHARRYLSGQAEIAREAASAIKTPIGELAGRVAQLAGGTPQAGTRTGRSQEAAGAGRPGAKRRR